MYPRRREYIADIHATAAVQARSIAGGAGPPSTAAILAPIVAGIVGAAGPVVAQLATSNPEDRAKAEAVAALLAKFLEGAVSAEASRDPGGDRRSGVNPAQRAVGRGGAGAVAGGGG